MPGAISPCQYLNMVANTHPERLTPAMRKRLATCNPSTADAIAQDLIALGGFGGLGLPLLEQGAGKAATAAGGAGAAAKTVAGAAGKKAASTVAKDALKAGAAGGFLAAVNMSAMTAIIIRLGEIILGAALLLLGLKALTGGSGDPVAAAKRVVKKIR